MLLPFRIQPSQKRPRYGQSAGSSQVERKTALSARGYGFFSKFSAAEFMQ